MASCNESGIDRDCTCSSKFGPGVNSKVYDFGTQEFVCCGTVGYDLHNAIVENDNDLKNGAASMDDIRCFNWWRGTIDSKEQSAVAGAGPSQSKLTALEHLATLSQAFPPPDIDGTTGEYSCVGKVSGLSTLHTVPRYLAYRNPNAGDKYVETVACIPHDDSNPNTPYNNVIPFLFSQNEDFAIFKIDTCNDLTNQVCIPTAGINQAKLGTQEFASQLYTGGKFPDHGNQCCNMDSNIMWLIIVILGALLFILLLVVLYYVFRKQPTPVPQYGQVVSPVPVYYPPPPQPQFAPAGYYQQPQPIPTYPVQGNMMVQPRPAAFNVAPPTAYTTTTTVTSPGQPVPFTGGNFTRSNSAAISATLAPEFR